LRGQQVERRFREPRGYDPGGDSVPWLAVCCRYLVEWQVEYPEGDADFTSGVYAFKVLG
jgi:hypothetical protein